MKIAFQLDRQTIKRTDTNTVVAGSKNYLYAKFTAVSGDWTAPITAIFGAYAVVLNEQNECLVPWEVLQNPGSFEVSAFCGDLHTANVESVKVEATGYKPGETPSDPTPDVYQQLTSMVQEAIDTAQSVRNDADAGKFDGAPGEPGKTPERGVDYWTEEDKQEIVDEVLKQVPSGGGGGDYVIGDGLKLEGVVLSVDTATSVEEDNTKPITSAAVFQTVGNIEILLGTI